MGGSSISIIVAKSSVLVPSPLSRADERSSRISEFEMRREPPVVPRVVLVTVDTTELGLAGEIAERVTERGTPLAQP